MKACPELNSPRSVLIIDNSAESREVFRTVLSTRGIELLEASNARQGLEMLRQHHPRVVVLDLEAQQADDEMLRDEYDHESASQQASLVILGTARRYDAALPKDRVVPKPYHYGPVIRTIERLL
ncbi:MAG: hypothetical protein KDA62_09980 [Planctomycetales bacterium]|nr:hypothetical protein [Planctomycetales bacterium]MCA9163300.1 hypothetical protein [Planctomycetales bacterium]MCA9222717.1 hypothetical protein [Planctomycetales bacterium]